MIYDEIQQKLINNNWMYRTCESSMRVRTVATTTYYTITSTILLVQYGSNSD